jgi:hypothetical protein
MGEEERSAKGFFEYLVSSEVARVVIEAGAVAAIGPAGVAVPIAGRAIEYFGPPVIRRMWSYLGGRPKVEAAILLEEVANLDARAARQLARDAADANDELKAAPEAARQHLGAILSAIPAGLRQLLPRDEGGRTTCPADAFPGSEAELLQSFPLAVPPFVPPCELPGTGYWLEEIIGTGGFGAVYRATLKDEYEPRAIKVPGDPSRAESIRNEQRSLQRLIDSGTAWSRRVVRLYGHRLDADPPFLVYEYVPGGDLANFVRAYRRANGRAPSPDRALAIVREVAECLAVPHGAGMVHRDLKPSNLLLHRDGWKLADFGLGASADPFPGASLGGATATLGRELRGAGSPMYMCEEQRRRDPPDPRHDVYSAGIIWYQLLLGNFSRRLTPEWEEELRDRGVPENHVALIGRCIRGFKNRPVDGRSLVGEIDAIIRRLDEAKERQLAERAAETRRRAERSAELRSAIVRYAVAGAAGGIAFAIIGGAIGSGNSDKFATAVGQAIGVSVFTGFLTGLVMSILIHFMNARNPLKLMYLIVFGVGMLLPISLGILAAVADAYMDGTGVDGVRYAINGGAFGVIAGLIGRFVLDTGPVKEGLEWFRDW